MTRVTLCIFVILAVLFTTALAALHHWGGQWAANAYRPLLIEKATSALSRQRAGEAEQILLQALRSSPGYAPEILHLAADYVPIMPELAHALDDRSHDTSYNTPAATQPSSAAQDPYRKAVADLALGNRQQAQDALTELVNRGQALPDAAYQLGVCCEEEQNTRKALECYALAIQSSDAHLEAAQAFLRLSKRQ